MSEAMKALRAYLERYPMVEESIIVDMDDSAPPGVPPFTFGTLRALLAERTWRPISEAPRDGQAVLVWSRADGEDVAQLCDGEWYVAGYGNVKPTHFQALPPPPESSK